MLDRYTISLKSDELALILKTEVPSQYEPHYNAAPTKNLPVLVLGKNQMYLNFFCWGLMANWSNNKSMSEKFFNHHIHSSFIKPIYQKKILTKRCCVPMDGFYLWKKISKKQTVPYYFYFNDNRLFTVAGVWEENDENEISFTLLTKPANGQISNFQNDMPIILDLTDSVKWLNAISLEEIKELLFKEETTKDSLEFHTVSSRIKDISHNDALLMTSAPASDQHGNYTLFP